MNEKHCQCEVSLQELLDKAMRHALKKVAEALYGTEACSWSAAFETLSRVSLERERMSL